MDKVAKIVIPKTKTGTPDQPGRVVFFTEFHEGVQGCPSKSWTRLKRYRRHGAKRIFHWSDGSSITRKEFTVIVRTFMDDFGIHKGYAKETYKRLTWYTFRISLFVYLGLNCDLSIEEMRTLGGLE